LLLSCCYLQFLFREPGYAAEFHLYLLARADTFDGAFDRSSRFCETGGNDLGNLHNARLPETAADDNRQKISFRGAKRTVFHLSFRSGGLRKGIVTTRRLNCSPLFDEAGAVKRKLFTGSYRIIEPYQTEWPLGTSNNRPVVKS